MRINIKTAKKVTDKDLKALYIIKHALEISSKGMILPTLEYFADKYGFKIVKK